MHQLPRSHRVMLSLFLSLLAGFIQTNSTFSAQTSENLLVNGEFTKDTDGDGLADQWAFEPGAGNLEAEFALAEGPDGSPCQMIRCTKYWGINPGRSHVMLAQRGTLSLKAGGWYRLRFSVRAEGIAGRVIQVGVQDCADWEPAIESTAVEVGSRWRQVEKLLQAQKEVSATARFQIHFSEVGTIWIDNVDLVAVPAPPPRSRIVSWPENVTNPLINADFEAELTGWGSWNGGRILAVEETSTAASGQQCARLVAGSTETPVLYNDVKATVSPAPVTLVSLGLIPLATDRQYTLSAHLKTNRPHVRALMGIVSTRSQRTYEIVDVPTEWTRKHVTLSPAKPYGFVYIQPISSEPRPEELTLWVDAVQLEKGSEPSAFQVRVPIQLGASSFPRGGIALENEPLRVRIRAVNSLKAAWIGNLSIKVLDFFDRAVYTENRHLTLGPEGRREELVEIPAELGLGFFRFQYGLEGAYDKLHSLRLARIRPYRGSEYRFGLNHVYTYPAWQQRALQAGIGWGRSWAYSWPVVEPEQGMWNFGEPDRHLSYTSRTGMRFLALLPHSASNWSSMAPPGAAPYEPPRYTRERVGYRPRSISHWESYVDEIARHLRGRVSVFEVLNEPLWTEYALRPEGDYTVEDYAEMLSAAYKTIGEAAPGVAVIGGLSGLPRKHKRFHEELFTTDAVQNLDIFSIHDYPPDLDARIAEPALARLAEELEQRAGTQVPIWLTEFGYYADDDNDLDVFPRATARSWAASHSVKDEKRAAELTIQYNVVAAAHGVQKTFYHVAGGLAGIPNCDGGDEMFFEWNGAPRKIFPAQAALAELLRPNATFKEKIGIGPDGMLEFFLFESPDGTSAFTWTREGRKAKLVPGDEPGIVFRDLVGNPIQNATVTVDQSPIAIVSSKSASAVSRWLIENVSPTVSFQRVE